jgi:DNA helicase-2/ATP-dependent DNA helicase PcrA
MTLHGAKGLEFEIVFLPGWEEGLFPHPRSLDENGLAGLEEERRLAYVGLTRARRRAFVFHAANRQVRGLWQTSPPSRFIEELPADHVNFRNSDVGGSWGATVSRFDRLAFAGSNYSTPGWRRAQERDEGAQKRRAENVIEGRATRLDAPPSPYRAGERVFHQKFGPGSVYAVDGGKLTVDFDKAGRKMVMESFVSTLPGASR